LILYVRLERGRDAGLIFELTCSSSILTR
jgi:hypothetical protein